MAYLSVLPNRLRVLAADSSSLSTQLLVEALARDNHLHMIESPSNGRALLALVKQEKPNVVVVSANLDQAGSGDCDIVREILAESPETRVVVLLDASEREHVTSAFRAGARGVFCRTEPFRLLGKCIQCVHQGQVWASGTELLYLLEALAKPRFANLQTKDGPRLSARETEVVGCLAEGLTNREIAQRLKLTEHTVKNYLFRIFDKLGVSSRVEVVLYALGNAGPQAAPALTRGGNAEVLRVPLKSADSEPDHSSEGSRRKLSRPRFSAIGAD